VKTDPLVAGRVRVLVTVIDRGQAPLDALDPDMGGMLVGLGRFLGWTAEPLPAHTRHARRSLAHPAGHPNREGHVDARRRGRRADHPGPLIPADTRAEGRESGWTQHTRVRRIR
jgi:hypothetical protein